MFLEALSLISCDWYVYSSSNNRIFHSLRTELRDKKPVRTLPVSQASVPEPGSVLKNHFLMLEAVSLLLLFIYWKGLWACSLVSSHCGRELHSVQACRYLFLAYFPNASKEKQVALLRESLTTSVRNCSEGQQASRQSGQMGKMQAPESQSPGSCCFKGVTYMPTSCPLYNSMSPPFPAPGKGLLLLVFYIWVSIPVPELC